MFNKIITNKTSYYDGNTTNYSSYTTYEDNQANVLGLLKNSTRYFITASEHVIIVIHSGGALLGQATYEPESGDIKYKTEFRLLPSQIHWGDIPGPVLYTMKYPEILGRKVKVSPIGNKYGWYSDISNEEMRKLSKEIKPYEQVVHRSGYYDVGRLLDIYI